MVELDVLCERIEQVVSGGVSGRSAALMNVLHEAGQPAVMAGMLRTLLVRPEQVEEVARSSFLHRNGFVKLRLKTAAGYVLRLHVWTGDSTIQPEENVHDHRWSFASHMVCGFFRVKTYAMDEGGEHEFCCYRYVRHPLEDSFRFEDAGRRRFVLTGDQIMLAGNTYYMDASVFHRLLFPVNTTTATLVVTLPRSREWCYSCAELPREPEVDHEMEHLTVEQVREYVWHVLRTMEG
ncbi:MAG: hypothetical protein NTZ50_02645 [Chloroflexi bacterium]|nr:hypothetical protein [Chloroflexota bacterium]